MVKISLQHKIFLSYAILMIVIVSMVAVLFNEYHRMREMEVGTHTVKLTCREIFNVQHLITSLAFSGETIFMWQTEDYKTYHTERLKVDSMLQVLKVRHKDIGLSGQVDALRHLLEEKEAYLLNIFKAGHLGDTTDSLLLLYIPVNIGYLTTNRTAVHRQKENVELFSKKRIVQIPLTMNTLQSLNERLIAVQEKKKGDMETNMDSIRLYNKMLNGELHSLINILDSHAQTFFQYQEQDISQSCRRTAFIILGLIIMSAFLLVYSFRMIRNQQKHDMWLRKKMESIINKNDELLETRKNIILTISHDIRTPLNIINGSAELAMDTRDKKRRNIHLANIVLVGKHVLHLLNNLLDVYRLNESKETCNNVPFNLRTLLERISLGFSRIANDKGILFRSEFINVDFTLYGDVDRIEQIVDNLLSNAVKFTESGTISFNADYKNSLLSIKVTDTGIGMSKEVISHIFRPFERLSTGTNSEGFGLGLPITNGLVALLNGNITVESEPGQGSTFTVSLPLPVSDEAIEHAKPIIKNSQILPQSVLVIDNDNLQLEIVKEMLERNGVTCAVCSNIKELVMEMRKKVYDLLLSDIQMPKTDGFKVLTLLRNSNIGNSRSIPVVAMTARGDREKEFFIQSGFADCLYKPFSMSELLSLISAFAYHKEAEEVQAIDFKAFMADVHDKIKLLRIFIRQSNKSMEDLRSAISMKDMAALLEIVHQIQPALELLQADGLLPDYREMLKSETPDTEAICEYTEQIVRHLAQLVKDTEHEIKRLKNETRNIDS